MDDVTLKEQEERQFAQLAFTAPEPLRGTLSCCPEPQIAPEANSVRLRAIVGS